MAKTMTASKMTDGQIDGIANKLRDALRKHREEISSGIAQQIHGLPNLGMDLFSVILQHAERLGNLIIRTVEKVNRARSPQEVISAIGRRPYVNDEVVTAMPRGNGDGAEVIFFKPEEWEYTRPGYISDEDLEKAFDRRGLAPAFPDDLAAVNEADSAFADEKPNGTHWKDKDGKWCFLAFDRWGDERDVHCHRNDDGWPDDWWFAGRRKS